MHKASSSIRLAFAILVVVPLLALFAACGSGDSASTSASDDASVMSGDTTIGMVAVGGTVSGLLGHGLVLRNGNGDVLAIQGDGPFVFGQRIASGAPYDVTVSAQPTTPSQTCAVARGSGVAGTSDVTDVSVSCTTSAYTIGGTLTGLAPGQQLVLQDNGADDLTLSADGTFAFVSPVASGAAYSVTILAQPSGQSCSVTGGAGVVGSADVRSVVVNCAAATYTVGGVVTGLNGTLVLQDNGGDDLTVSANGTFAFATPLAGGATYAVTVLTQPTGQVCTLSNATGSIASSNVTTVSVNCAAATYTVGGTVSGLAAGATVTLQDNGGDNLVVSSNGPFAFSTALTPSATYAVTVLTQPPGQTCAVINGTGTIGASNVTTVSVACTTNVYTVGGTVTGLGAGHTVVLQNNGGDDLSVGANGTFAFATPLGSGSPYAVTILTQPSGQTCTVSSGAGTVGTADVTGVVVNCAANAFTVGGTLSGLAAGGSVVLQDNGGNDLTLSTNGGFTFTTPIVSGSAYAVTVLTQPVGQTCAVSSGTGTVASANVTSVSVSCATTTYTVGGTLSGLGAGKSIVLQDNGGDNLTVSANGTFTFKSTVAYGSAYAVTILTQPSGQTCSVTAGSGTVGAGNVTTVSVTCTTNTYTIGGTLSGLAAASSIVLQDNGGDNLTVSANGAFAFATPVASGASYAVTILTQPPGQTCAVTSGSGVVGAGNVTNVAVTCTTNTYAIGGTLSGLGAASSIVLQDNGGDNLTLGANGTFTFATKVASGAPYNVTILTQPAGQTCTVSGGAGNVAAANVTSVVVNCASNTYTIGGTLSGLNASASIVLQDNGGNNLTLTANGTWAFSQALASGSTYAVTILTQPVGQTCAVANGSGTVGTSNVTSVSVTCTTNTYTIGGTLSGLTAGKSALLQDNGGNNLTLTANGGFTFTTPLAAGAAYNVTVLTQPVGQTCVVTNGSGTVGTSNVTSVTVTCTTNTYTIGGTLSGLAAGKSVVLQDNGGNNLTLAANGGFTFTTPIASGATYAVTVFTQPVGQTCVVANGSGTVGTSNVTNVTVTCTTNTYTIGGTVSGLAAGKSAVLQDNGTDNLAVGANGTFAFATALASGATYAVTVLTQPVGQTCVVANGSGTVGASNVTNVTITCTTNTYTVGGSVSGLAAGKSVVLQDNGGDNLTVSANGGFTFATAIPSGGAYAVTVLTQPAGQTCVVASGSGTVVASNVTTVSVTCTTNTYTIGGSVSGLAAGKSVVLQDNGGDNLTVSANGGFTFATALPTGAAYAVTVLTQPAGESCAVTSGSGTVGSANVTTVTVTCTVIPACGNGVREGTEQCDDGNTTNLDGCNATCKFEQDTRATKLQLMFTTDAFCAANALGKSFTTLAQSTVQSTLDTNTGNGSANLLFVYLGITDLTGASGSVNVASVGGSPVPYVAPASGTSDLDWWYTVDPTTIDASRVPTAKPLPGTFAGGVLTAGPGHVLAAITGGTPLDFANTMLRLPIGATSTPTASTGTAPGHLASEHLDPTIKSFATAGGTNAAPTGQVCGNAVAASLAIAPVPSGLLGSTCTQNFTTSNSMLDVLVSGCNNLFFGAVVNATQPDATNPDVPAAGTGAPYKLSAGAGRVVNTCKDSSNAVVPLANCLNAAAYSTYVKFAADRVIIK